MKDARILASGEGIVLDSGKEADPSENYSSNKVYENYKGDREKTSDIDINWQKVPQQSLQLDVI